MNYFRKKQHKRPKGEKKLEGGNIF